MCGTAREALVLFGVGGGRVKLRKGVAITDGRAGDAGNCAGGTAMRSYMGA